MDEPLKKACLILLSRLIFHDTLYKTKIKINTIIYYYYIFNGHESINYYYREIKVWLISVLMIINKVRINNLF